MSFRNTLHYSGIAHTVLSTSNLGDVFGGVFHVFKFASLSFMWGTSKASTFQMAILLQYNTEDAYAVQQLTDSTQIKMVFFPFSPS